MKARVKATGEVVEVKSKVITSPVTGKSLLKYVDQTTGISYFEEDLFFPKDLTQDLDYWTRLEHQYAGMAMQGILSDNVAMEQIVYNQEGMIAKIVANFAVTCAHALVQKMKEEENGNMA